MWNTVKKSTLGKPLGAGMSINSNNDGKCSENKEINYVSEGDLGDISSAGGGSLVCNDVEKSPDFRPSLDI